MNRVQLSFLGKVQGGPRCYQKARYGFPDGAVQETAFFGFALARHDPPDRLVVLGTTGSMWQVLLEEAGCWEQHLDLCQALEDASREDRVGSAELEALAQALGDGDGTPVRPLLIPYCRNPDEQRQLLTRIAGVVADGDRVILDVTHGLRHLPLLAFTSALYLQAVRAATVEAIYYGALDLREPGQDVVPVLRLEGLLKVAAWTQAVGQFRQTGDYGLFAPLLEGEGLDHEEAQCLRRAAFLERTVQVDPARREVSRFLGLLQRELPGPAGLFAPHLRKQLSWVGSGDLQAYQRRLARESLRRSDYLRAATLGYEAVVTGLVTSAADVTDPEARQEAAKAFARQPGERSRAFRRLRAVRNALAHAGPRGQLPAQEDDLRDLLTRLLEQLEALQPRRAPRRADPTSATRPPVGKPCPKSLPPKGLHRQAMRRET